MSGISLHVVDVTRAKPAGGMSVEIFRLDGGAPVSVARGTLGPGGALDHPIAAGEGVDAGRYEAVMHIGDYYRAEGFDLAEPAFLEAAPFRFTVQDAAEHYHLPVKMTPWGYSVFRGS